MTMTTTLREQLTQTDWPDQRAIHQVLDVLLTKVIDPLEKRVESLENQIASWLPKAMTTSDALEAVDEETSPTPPSEDPAIDLGDSPDSPSPVGPANAAPVEASDPAETLTPPMPPPVG